MKLGLQPQPTAPWRPYMFRVYCLITERWMKIRVPFAYYWYGSKEYGTPEVEVGSIMNNPNPKPPPEAVAAHEARKKAMEGEVPIQDEAIQAPERSPEENHRDGWQNGAVHGAADGEDEGRN